MGVPSLEEIDVVPRVPLVVKKKVPKSKARS